VPEFHLIADCWQGISGDRLPVAGRLHSRTKKQTHMLEYHTVTQREDQGSTYDIQVGSKTRSSSTNITLDHAARFTNMSLQCRKDSKYHRQE